MPSIGGKGVSKGSKHMGEGLLGQPRDRRRKPRMQHGLCLIWKLYPPHAGSKAKDVVEGRDKTDSTRQTRNFLYMVPEAARDGTVVIQVQGWGGVRTRLSCGCA